MKPANDISAWMIAAFLPLPIKSSSAEADQDPNNMEKSSDYSRHIAPLDDARYESAKWWRNLNRYMCLVGIVIIIIVVRSSSTSSNPYI